MGFRKGLLVPQLGISPISSVQVTLDAQLAPEDAARGEDDREFRSVLPGHYSSRDFPTVLREALRNVTRKWNTFISSH